MRGGSVPEFLRDLLAHCHEIGFFEYTEISLLIIVTTIKFICHVGQICLFSLCGCLELSQIILNLSWVIGERSQVFNLQAFEKDLCPSALVARGGGGSTSLYKPYRYVLPQRVWLLGLFGLKTCIQYMVRGPDEKDVNEYSLS